MRRYTRPEQQLLLSDAAIFWYSLFFIRDLLNIFGLYNKNDKITPNIVLSMQQKFRDMTKQDLKERAMFFLKRVGLDESVYNKYPNELSGGMRQRCAICRSFALDPPILLMDEPFGALDAVTRAHLQNLILSLWNQDSGTRKTIFFVTHDVEEALYLSTKIYVFGLKPSRVIYSCVLDKARFCTREQLLNDPKISSLRQQLVTILNNDIETKLN